MGSRRRHCRTIISRAPGKRSLESSFLILVCSRHRLNHYSCHVKPQKSGNRFLLRGLISRRSPFGNKIHMLYVKPSVRKHCALDFRAAGNLRGIVLRPELTRLTGVRSGVCQAQFVRLSGRQRPTHARGTIGCAKRHAPAAHYFGLSSSRFPGTRRTLMDRVSTV